MRKEILLASMALLIVGCGSQPTKSPTPKAAAAATVQADKYPDKLVLDNTSTWYWGDRTEVEMRGRLDGFSTRIKVAKAKATGQVTHDVTGSFMSARQLERALEAATLNPGAWQMDVRRAIDMLRWGRGEAPLTPTIQVDPPAAEAQ